MSDCCGSGCVGYIRSITLCSLRFRSISRHTPPCKLWLAEDPDSWAERVVAIETIRLTGDFQRDFSNGNTLTDIFGSVRTLEAVLVLELLFFFSSRRRHTRFDCDWSSSSD